uniref:Reelin n=1 Tax=Poeciliopsis prolifica TaxID=188132 RepID=A0A0S7ESD7_9TELE
MHHIPSWTEVKSSQRRENSFSFSSEIHLTFLLKLCFLSLCRSLNKPHPFQHKAAFPSYLNTSLILKCLAGLDLDTTNTRLAQFYIRIGSKSLGPTCTRPRSRNEGVIVQFSTNNGIQWQFLRELDFSSFLEPQVVTIELPPPAKTPYTVFRQQFF